jgi:hypothetical protein
MKNMEDKLIEQLKNGTCPFTGQRYDCARCEVEPEHHRIPCGDDSSKSVWHMCFCITRFVQGHTDKREMKRIAKGFTLEDGSNPSPEYLLEYFAELYRLGAEKIPMCDCKRFCFKHGCMGD